jgi:hypothetical protein
MAFHSLPRSHKAAPAPVSPSDPRPAHNLRSESRVHRNKDITHLVLPQAQGRKLEVSVSVIAGERWITVRLYVRYSSLRTVHAACELSRASIEFYPRSDVHDSP